MIYLDYNATTPMDPRVFEAMRPFHLERFGNAASRQHAMGCGAATAVEQARAQVAHLIGADPREIHWTSGATESDNLALFGAAQSDHYAARDRHVVTVRTEHTAILDPCHELERRGFRVTYLGVDADGRLDLAELDAAVTERTLLVSVMHANNETGVIHPLRDIGRITRGRSALFHTDATQTFGKETIDVDELGIDLLSFSAHKIYGPKGVGGLYVRRRRPRARLAAQILGGGHERGLRSGTLNVPGIIGLGVAAEIAGAEAAAERERVAGLRDHLEATLMQIEGTRRNGPADPRLAGTTNLSFGDTDAQAVLRRLDQVCASTASACTSALFQPSHVLGAMGLDDERIHSSIRFSLGRFTTPDEIERAAGEVRAAIAAEAG